MWKLKLVVVLVLQVSAAPTTDAWAKINLKQVWKN